VRLSFVAGQLDLFPFRLPASDNTDMTDAQRDARSPDQWLCSVISYCDWRTGDSWRRRSDRNHREDQDRADWLDASRRVRTIRHLVSPSKFPPVSASVDSEVTRLASQPRSALVADLMRLDSTLTDSRILLTLGRSKLAAMLWERQTSRPDTPEKVRA
jgi:hypothetical protein